MYTLPKLEYDYSALSTYISGDIMRLHHDKHHQTYVDKLNAALESTPELARLALPELLRLDHLPDSIRNNGGGHYNHSLFWQWMSPNGGGEPNGELGERLERKYGSYQKFTEVFTDKALGVFGSGWVWLQGDFEIVTTPNQDTPMLAGKGEPILGLDVWEHAYYLDYKNVRADYVAAWWNVVNWEFVSHRYGQLNGVNKQ